MNSNGNGCCTIIRSSANTSGVGSSSISRTSTSTSDVSAELSLSNGGDNSFQWSDAMKSAMHVSVS